MSAAATLFVSAVRTDAAAPFEDTSESAVAVGTVSTEAALSPAFGVATAAEDLVLFALETGASDATEASDACARDLFGFLEDVPPLSSIGPEALRAADTVVFAAAFVIDIAGALAGFLAFTGASVASALAGVFVTFTPAFGLACTAALFKDFPTA